MFIYLYDENPSMLQSNAHDALQGLEGTHVQWINKDKIFEQFKSYQTKCYFIFSYFSGESYEYIKNLNMIIFGPQLILDCLRNDEQLPRSTLPVYSKAMNGMVVSFTGIKLVDRESLQERVTMMSGTVSRDLTEGVTIVVAEMVGSHKYLVAGERRIPIMRPLWVRRLWELSGEQDPVEPWHEELMVDCRLPILHGLCISVTGLTTNERSQVRLLVERHGGSYMADLQVGMCTHLVARQSPRGQKCLYANKWRIPVVSQSWLTDSVERGYALDVASYNLPNCVSSTESSTPKSDSHSRPHSLTSEFSIINVSKVGETMICSDNDGENETIDPLSTLFLQCVVSFVDLDVTDQNKWSTIVKNYGGTVATTYVTHSIVIDPSSITANLPGKHVSPAWLQSCIDEQRLVDETSFIVSAFVDVQWDTLDSYVFADNLGFLCQTHFYLHESLCAKDRERATSIVVNNGGVIAQEVVDRGFVVSSECLMAPIKSASCSATVVTAFYLQKCVEHNEILETASDFLYSPIVVTGSLKKVLSQCVLSFSGYEPEERQLLKSICKELGAVVQDSMARKAVPLKKILATTHLIISKVDKQKYPSSINWRIPAVTRHWIGQCVSAGYRVPTTEYQLQADPNMSVMSVAPDHNLNETYMSVNTAPPRPRGPGSSTDTTQPIVVNKHLHIRNNASTHAGNDANMSFGNLDTPIRLSACHGSREVDMDNLRQMMTTPDYCANLERGAGASFTTPDIERGLKARLAMLQVEETACTDMSDFSFSESRSSSAQMPLSSVVVYLSKSVGNACQISLIGKIDKLGGSRTWLYEPRTVTHVICNEASISERNREELERAVSDGKMVVTEDWLTQCCDEYRRVEEHAFIVRLDRAEIVPESQSRKRRSPNEENVELADIANVVETRPGVRRKVPTEETDDLAWEYASKEQTVSGTELCGDETQLEESSVCVSVKKVFMFSSLEQEERQKYQLVLESLGARVDSGDCVASISHLICSSPSRGEKYLAAVAAGKWILHKSYLEAVVRAGDWVEEADYEFGGPRSAGLVQDTTVSKAGSQDVSLAAAANRWREIGGGAFKEWRVGILDCEERAEKMGNIVECGGGVVVPMTPLPSPDNVTHLLVNKKSCPSSVDLAQLAQFTCYKIELIQFFLTARTQAETKKFTKKLLITSEEIAALTEPQTGPARRSRLSRP